MNDFTKEELKILFLELNIAIRHWGDAKEYKDYPILKDKIQNMIDNYCKHESDGKVYELQPEYKCKNCGEFYI
jgi:hypothetical protein